MTDPKPSKNRKKTNRNFILNTEQNDKDMFTACAPRPPCPVFFQSIRALREKLAQAPLWRVQKPMAQATPTSAETTGRDHEISHEDLLVAVGQKQDRKAFAVLFAYFGPRIKSYLMKHGASETAAEEILQNTFVTVWEKAGGFNPQKAAASTWLFTIARNKRIDALRREKYISYDSDALAMTQAPGSTAAPDEAYVDAKTVEKLSAAMKSLPPEQSELLQMAYFEDKSHQAIADETKIPLGTVKSRLRLALEKLRQQFAADSKEGEAG